MKSLNTQLNNCIAIGIALQAGLFSVTSGAQAQSSGREGHGGISVVCRDPQNRITSATLLDFYEAENDPLVNIPIQRSNKPYQEQIAGLISEMDSNDYINHKIYLTDDLSKYYDLVTKSAIYLNSPVARLTPSTDFNTRIEPRPPCGFEAAARYDQLGKLIIEQEIYQKFSETDKAGLWVHEALYRAAREFKNAQNSDSVRELVAALFSKASSPEVKRALIDDKDDGIYAEGTKLVDYQNLWIARDNFTFNIWMGVTTHGSGGEAVYTYRGPKGWGSISSYMTTDIEVQMHRYSNTITFQKARCTIPVQELWYSIKVDRESSQGSWMQVYTSNVRIDFSDRTKASIRLIQ